MGAPTAQVQSPLQPSGKGGYSSRPSSTLANSAVNPPPPSDPNFDPNSLMQGGPGVGDFLQPMGGLGQRIGGFGGGFGQPMGGFEQPQRNDMSTMQQQNDLRDRMQSIQRPEQGQEYGAAVQPQRQMQPQGKGGAITTPVQSGQPSIGRPNTYANTVGPWDNSTNSTQMPFKGKGKGA